MAFEKGQSGNPAGQSLLTKETEEFLSLTLEQRRAYLKDLWSEVAFTITKRAKSMAKTVSTKDIGRLYQLVMSGAVSLDKAFPPKEVSGQTLSINLFGSLGQKAVGIVQPEIPVIEGRVTKEIVHAPESNESSFNPVLSRTDVDPLRLPGGEGPGDGGTSGEV